MVKCSINLPAISVQAVDTIDCLKFLKCCDDPTFWLRENNGNRLVVAMSLCNCGYKSLLEQDSSPVLGMTLFCSNKLRKGTVKIGPRKSPDIVKKENSVLVSPPKYCVCS